MSREGRLRRRVREYMSERGSKPERREAPAERLDYVGWLDVDFLADNASMLTIFKSSGHSLDLGEAIAKIAGAEREEGYWPAMRLDVRMTIEVLDSPDVDAVDGRG